jgi:hypothetical protein
MLVKNLVAVIGVSDYMGNKKVLEVRTDNQKLFYSLTNSNRTSFAISNMQTNLPMYVFDFKGLYEAIHAVRQAVKKSVYYETSFKCLV